MIMINYFIVMLKLEQGKGSCIKFYNCINIYSEVKGGNISS